MPISVLLINARSLKKHSEELEALVYSLESPPNIVAVTETWLDKEDDEKLYKLSGYNVVSKPRPTRGGRILFQSLKEVKIIKVLDCSIDESLMLELKIRGNKVIFLVIYNPPRNNKLEFIEKLDEVLESLQYLNCEVIVCGDINIDIKKHNSATAKYIDAIESNGFSLLSFSPTRVGENSETCLDHFITNVSDSIVSVLTHQNFADHYPVIMKFNKDSSDNDNEAILVRDTSFLKSAEKVQNFNFVLLHEMNNLSLNENENVNNTFSRFHKTLLKVLDQFALMIKKVNKTTKCPPWISNKIKNLITKRNKQHHLLVQSKYTHLIKLRYKELNDRVRSEIRSSKKSFCLKKFQTCIGDSRQIYKFLNMLKGSNGSNRDISDIISESGDRHTDPQTIANNFNNFFGQIADKLVKQLSTPELEIRIKEPIVSIYLKPVNENEIASILSDLKSKASVGLDDVSNNILKACAYAIIPSLTILINASIKQAIFPTGLSQAKILPFHKDGSKLDLNNYRPIALLLTLGKIFERVMFNRIYNYLEQFNFIYCKQFGNRFKHNTIDAIAEVTEKLRLSNKKFIPSIFLDLKKAFDTLNHDILIKKLPYYGLVGKCLQWIVSYL